MSQEGAAFYLHEDDWGMAELLPSENLAFLHAERERLDAFSAAHFDGIGWTDIVVRSQEPIPMTSRAIPYARLAELFGSLLPAAERVETGYSSHREPCPGCFAFGRSYDFALYGSVKDGIVTALSLCMHAPSFDATLRQKLAAAFGRLGGEYRLVLVDWQRSQIVDLAEQAEVAHYLTVLERFPAYFLVAEHDGRLVGYIHGKARFLAPLLRQEIVYRLLMGAQRGRLAHIAALGSNSQRITAAIERFRKEFNQPLRIEDVARELGMSVSGFHHHFKVLTTMSPLQFQKQLRLQEARRLMLGEGLDAASAGYRVGYDAAAYFNREYKKLFGAPPVRDVERLRENALEPTSL